MTLVLGVILVGLFVLAAKEPPSENAQPLDAWAAALFVAAVGVLVAAGRRYPATVTLVVLGLSVLWYTRYTNRLMDIPATVGFYLLGTTGDRARQFGVGGFAVLLLLVAAATSDVELAAQSVGWTVAAILAGELVRSRRLLLEEYAARAAHAEAERDAEARRQVAQERLRIARDVHDVLAHTVSVMTVQAGVAADAVDRDPGAVRSALATLRSAGKDAMAEVRAIVAVLRGQDGPAAMAPAPGLAGVADLAEAARAQGLAVEVDLDLDGVELEGLVELTAYRVVQEALTNVIRHAEAGRAAVRIRPGPVGLLVEVTDDGRGAVGTGPGFGLRGMTERVESVGGTLTFGPRTGQGWTVSATLPTRDSPAGGAGDRDDTHDDNDTGDRGADTGARDADTGDHDNDTGDRGAGSGKESEARP